jgi:hypothetical protein
MAVLHQKLHIFAVYVLMAPHGYCVGIDGEIIKYKFGLAPGGIIFIPNFMKIYQLRGY